MIGLDAADDAAVWSWAQRENRIVVSKDEDFLFLANRPKETGRLRWVRLRNCRRETLLAAFNQALDSALAAFADGQRVVEIG